MNQPADSENKQEKTKIPRREFLSRAIQAGVASAVAASMGYCLYDGRGPSFALEEKIVQLPSFSIPGTEHKIAIVQATDRVKAVQKAFQALGGIETFIKKGDKVLLKVNAAFATPPMLCATTHPDLVAEVARLCLQAGASAVVVTDNPINDPMTCFAMSGIAQACESSGASLMLPKHTFFYPTSVKGGHLIQNWPLLYEPFRGVTKLIGIAPVKDHYRSGASLGMKNWYGLLGGRRNVFHQDIHNTIKELAMMVQPTLVILDGIFSMLGNGPTGGALSDLKQTNTMIAGTDQVAVDAYAATLLDKSQDSLPYIKKAQEQGRGTSDYESIRPIRTRVE